MKPVIPGKTDRMLLVEVLYVAAIVAVLVYWVEAHGTPYQHCQQQLEHLTPQAAADTCAPLIDTR